MAAFKKSYGIALAVVALSLTLMGVVLAATDPNPSGIGKDVLVLNGIPPRSTSLLVTVSNGQSYTVSATINAPGAIHLACANAASAAGTRPRP